MVARLEVERSCSPTSRSVTKFSSPPGGNALDDRGSGWRRRSRRRTSASASVDGRLRLLHARGELLGLGDERGLLLLRRLRDRLAEGVLLGAQRLELGDRGATRDVGGEASSTSSTESPRACCDLLDEVGVVAQQLGIDHRRSSPSDVEATDRPVIRRSVAAVTPSHDGRRQYGGHEPPSRHRRGSEARLGRSQSLQPDQGRRSPTAQEVGATPPAEGRLGRDPLVRRPRSRTRAAA